MHILDWIFNISYLLIAIGLTRLFYIRLYDGHWCKGELKDDPMAGFVSTVMGLFWPISIAAFMLWLMCKHTVFAPTPKQREEVRREREEKMALEMQRLQRQTQQAANSVDPPLPTPRWNVSDPPGYYQFGNQRAKRIEDVDWD